MLPVVSLLVLAFAVSLDGFGVGVLYGLRKIRLPLSSIAIISGLSGTVILVAMQIGVWLSAFFPPSLAKQVGAVILIGIGCWAVLNVLRQKDEHGPEADDTAPSSFISAPTTVMSIELKRLGLMIQILRTPSKADVDRSGTISASEAALLGLALSLDAFGAGIGAALIGFQPFLTAAVIAVSSGLFLTTGLRVGYQFAGFVWMRRLSILPGFILVLMGILKLM
jgi:putative sporulation protein YtaF